MIIPSVKDMKKNNHRKNVRTWAFLAIALLLTITVPKHSIVTAEQEESYASESIPETNSERNSERNSEGSLEGNSESDGLVLNEEETTEDGAATGANEKPSTETKPVSSDAAVDATDKGTTSADTSKEAGAENTETEDAETNRNETEILTADLTEDEDTDETTSEPLDIEKYISNVVISYKGESDSDWIEINTNTTDIPVNAQLKFSMTYEELPVQTVKKHANTISYTLPELLKNPAVQSGTVQDSSGMKIGTIQASKDMKRILLTFTEEFLKTEEDGSTKTISGSFVFYAYPDEEKAKKDPEQKITVGTKEITLSFEKDSDARLGELNLTKSEATFGTDEQGAYLEYTLTIQAGSTAMPDVTVTDHFTTNANYIESYIGITGTESALAAMTATGSEVTAQTTPYETGTNAGKGKIYLGNSITEENPIPTAAGSNLTTPGVLVWKIGDLGANERRTLTYRARLKDLYVGAQSRGTITNEAASYSKTYPHTSVSKDFTPVAKVTTNKKVGEFVKDESGDGGTLSYQVTISADKDNTYTLKNVKINDSLKNGGTQNKYLSSLHYVENSFQLYEGTEITESAKIETGSNPHTDKRNPDIAETGSGSSIERKFDYYIAELAPGETRTLVYQISVSGDIYGAGNTAIEIKNNAATYSDDTVTDGNKSFSSSRTTKTLGKKIWDRKLQSEALTEATNVTISKGSPIYIQEDTSWNSTASSADTIFTVPKNSFRYQVVVNEAADWDVTSAVFGDALANDYLAYSGYLRLDYYSTGLAETPESDAAAVQALQNQTICSTLWVNIDGQKSFQFTPTDLHLENNGGAYVLTYYATARNTENISQVNSGNSFTLSGTVIGPGGTRVTLSGIKVTTSVIIEGEKSLQAEKSGWYFDHTKAASGDWTNGSLYWVIEVSGTEIAEGTQLKDTVGSSPDHYMRGTSMVGVYLGTLPEGESFTHYYGMVEELSEDTGDGKNLTKLSGNETNGGTIPANADYSWKADNNTATITFQKTISLDGDQHLYIVLRTAPSSALNGRDARTYTNSLSLKDSSATSFVKINDATLCATGAGTNFKEAAGVFEYDGSTWKKISTSGNLSQLVKSEIKDPGTYIEWRIKINYAGDLEGKVEVEDLLPEGLDPVYVRYFWISSEIYDSPPQMPEIQKLEENSAWTKLTYTGRIDGTSTDNKDHTAIAYYNSTTRQLCFDVSNLQKGGSAADRCSLEVQVVTKVSDSSLMTNGGSKTYTNGITVRNEAGKIISTSSASANITKKTIDKSMGSINGGKLSFTLTVNPLGEDLAVNADSLTLVDEMDDPLSFDTDSLTVKDKDGNSVSFLSQIENVDGGQKLTLTLPDEKCLTVTYQAMINSAPNQQITVNNKANWYGYRTDMAKIENQKVSYTVEATAETSSTPVLEIKKADQNNTTQALSGATFSLEEVEWDETENTWKKLEGGLSLTGTTGEDGSLSFGKSSDNREKLKYNTVYCLTETKAPEGYVQNTESGYYVIAKVDKATGNYPDELETWEQKGAKIYYSGITYRVTVYNKKGSLALEKKFQNINSEAVEGAEIPDGTYRFGIYAEDSDEKLQELSLTYAGGKLTCQRDGTIVEKAEFNELSVGTRYCILELDKDGEPIEASSTLATMANGLRFRVTYHETSVEIPTTGDGGTVTITNRQDVDTIPETGIHTDSNLLYAGILASIILLAGGAFLFRRRKR